MKKTARRNEREHRRTAFVAARISEESRHLLEVISLIQGESLSSIIERGIESIARTKEEFGGAVVVGAIDEEGFSDDVHIAYETWAPEEWLRRLKLSLIAPQLLRPAERAFWRSICANKAYWISLPDGSPNTTSKRRLGPLSTYGYPVEQAIGTAWERYKATASGSADKTPSTSMQTTIDNA